MSAKALPRPSLTPRLYDLARAIYALAAEESVREGEAPAELAARVDLIEGLMHPDMPLAEVEARWRTWFG